MSNGKVFLFALLFLAIFFLAAWEAVIAPAMAALGVAVPF